MIYKDLTMTTYHEKLLTGERRVSDQSTAKPLIKNELILKNAGLKGEKALSYYLSFLPNKKYILLHNLRLKNEAGFYFQIDALVLMPNCFIILDAKNYTGKVTYEANFKQFIQEKEDTREVINEPLQQVERQAMQLQQLLRVLIKNKIPNILTFVVFTNPSVYLSISPENAKIPSNLIRLESLPSVLHNLENQIQTDVLTMNELRQLAKELIKRDTPYDANIIKKFNIIRETDLITGVHCPRCFKLKMNKVPNKTTWICPYCNFKSNDAILHSIKDHYLLFGPKITNRELRWFLEIESPTIIKKLLKKINAKQTGAGSATVYLLNDPIT